MTVVVDASVLIAALVDSGADGQWAESVLSEGGLVAPELMLVETANVLRRLERQRLVSSSQATGAFRDLLNLDIRLVPSATLIALVWPLRHNFTSYDALYVATADLLDAPLATLDQKMASQAGYCRFLVSERD